MPVTRIVSKLYGRVLRMLPSPFRETYAEDMAKTFDDRMRQARVETGWFATLGVANREIVGALITVFNERRHRDRWPKKRFAERWRNLVNELIRSVRTLAVSPTFTIPVVLTLALGIGAITGMFAVIRGVVMKPLSYPNADAVVWLDHSAAGIGVQNGLGLTAGLYTYYAEQPEFISVGIFDEGTVTFVDVMGPERVNIARVTPSISNVLQTQPQRGRWFFDNDQTVETSTVVLSHDLWLRRYGGDPDIIGSSIRVQGVPTEIVGIMPPNYDFPTSETDAWLPLRIDPNDGFGGFNYRGIARLSPGVSTVNATARLNQAISRLPQRFDDPFATSVVTDTQIRALVTTLREERVGNVRVTLWTLLGSLGMVLILACLNVTNLVLVRAETKSQDTSIRTALGASRLHLLAHFFSEIALLVTIATAGGIAVAGLGIKALVSIDPANLPRLHEISIDRYVLGFTGLLATCITLLLTTVRFFRSVGSRQYVGRGAAAGHSLGADRFRQTIGIAQVGIALVLLVGTGLMIKTFKNMRNVDLGFSSDRVLTFEIGLPRSDYSTSQQAADFQRELIVQLQSLPGASTVGAVSRCLPLGGWCGGDPLAVEGRVVPAGEIPPIVALRTATPGYLDAMKIPLLAGRWLEESDNNGENVVVVSKALAEAYWPNGETLGARVSDLGSATPDSAWYRVVGVVGNTPARSVTDIDSPIIYFPAVSRGNRFPTVHTMRVVMRTNVPPLSLVSSARAVVNSLDPNVPLANVESLRRIVNKATAQTSFVTVLLGTASVLALVLGMLGVYSIISYTVTRRNAEIGIRLALGANPRDVNRMILRYTGQVATIGCLAGLIATTALSRFMQSFLYRVSPTDVVTYVAVTGALLLATLMAGYVPARRAARADPTNALKG